MHTCVSMPAIKTCFRFRAFSACIKRSFWQQLKVILLMGWILDKRSAISGIVGPRPLGFCSGQIIGIRNICIPLISFCAFLNRSSFPYIEFARLPWISTISKEAFSILSMMYPLLLLCASFHSFVSVLLYIFCRIISIISILHFIIYIFFVLENIDCRSITLLSFQRAPGTKMQASYAA